MASDTVPAPDRPLRWGVLATGRIAGSFAGDLALLSDHEVVAAGSRTLANAEAFLAEHGSEGARAHGSYEALAADPDVDVVYVASPHGRHLEDVVLCLDAGQSGVVLSSIANRETARLYCKQVHAGEGELELSPEEAEAVRIALSGEVGSVTLD